MRLYKHFNPTLKAGGFRHHENIRRFLVRVLIYVDFPWNIIGTLRFALWLWGGWIFCVIWSNHSHSNTSRKIFWGETTAKASKRFIRIRLLRTECVCGAKKRNDFDERNEILCGAKNCNRDFGNDISDDEDDAGDDSSGAWVTPPALRTVKPHPDPIINKPPHHGGPLQKKSIWNFETWLPKHGFRKEHARKRGELVPQKRSPSLSHCGGRILPTTYSCGSLHLWFSVLKNFLF